MSSAMIPYWLMAFLIPMGLVWLLTPHVISVARKVGAMDHPGERKVHQVSVPRFGGVGILLALVISMPLLYLFTPLFDGLLDHLSQVILISSAVTVLFLLGLMDDFRSLNPGFKFVVQFLAAGMVYVSGFSITAVTHPLDGSLLFVGFLDLPLTLLWIVGITNAFNLIDGLDGLASGVAVIASLAIFGVALMAGDLWTAGFVCVMTGAMIGFLRYNFHPAKIFLGDSGSLMIGFYLAVISIQSTTKISTGFTLLFPVLVLMLPITDTLISMVRRFLGSILKERDQTSDVSDTSLLNRIYGMFRPDRSHIHHQLLSLGFSHRGTVLTLYGVTGFFASCAFLYTRIEQPEQSLALLLFIGLMLFLGIRQLRYYEISIFQNGLMLPISEKWLRNRTRFMSLFDLTFVIAATLLASRIVQLPVPFNEPLLSGGGLLWLVVIIQLAIFRVTGLYRGWYRQPGIGNALTSISSVAYASAASALFWMLAGRLSISLLLPYLLVHFYLLITFVLGIRMFHEVLNFWFSRYNRAGKPVLIYGANENGSMILHKLMNDPDRDVRVVGFLDDDPAKAGRQAYGYPILGGHWILARFNRRHPVEAIYLCEEHVKQEDLKRLKKTVTACGIELRRLQVKLERLDPQPEIEPAPVRKSYPDPVSMA